MVSDEVNIFFTTYKLLLESIILTITEFNYYIGLPSSLTVITRSTLDCRTLYSLPGMH